MLQEVSGKLLGFTSCLMDSRKDGFSFPIPDRSDYVTRENINPDLLDTTSPLLPLLPGVYLNNVFLFGSIWAGFFLWVPLLGFIIDVKKSLPS